MAKLTAKFIRDALKQGHVWDLGNDVLYKLCGEYPDHTSDNVIIAKTWLIGRAYAAALERRRMIGDFVGDAFYEENVAPRIRTSDIDVWLERSRCENDLTGRYAIETHKKLTDLLYDITGLNKRSFASKYLHFHFPEKFYIYDTRAEKSAKEIAATLGLRKIKRKKDAAIDTLYGAFVANCEQLHEKFETLSEEKLAPRQLDKVLLWWNRK